MTNFKIYSAISLMFSYGFALAEPAVVTDLSVTKASDSAISIKTSESERQCFIDQKIIGLKLSSDRQAVIVSGQSFIRVADLVQCRPDKVLHAERAAPHAAFLSDINLRAGIYASMIPVSTNPLSFLAVVAKIGSDRNIISLSEFYRKGVSKYKVLREASSGMLPVISRSAHYVSLDLHGCGSEDSVVVIDLRSRAEVKIGRKLCEQDFSFQ